MNKTRQLIFISGFLYILEQPKKRQEKVIKVVNLRRLFRIEMALNKVNSK